MEKIWFVHADDSHRGPFDKKQIHLLLDTGRINPQNLLWKEGMNDWSPVLDIDDFSGRFQTKKLNASSLWTKNSNHQENESSAKLRGQDLDELMNYCPENHPSYLRHDNVPMDPPFDEQNFPKKTEFFGQDELDSVLNDLNKIEKNETATVAQTEAIFDELPPPLPSFQKLETEIPLNFAFSWAKRILLTGVYVFILASLTFGFLHYYKNRAPFSRPEEMGKRDYQRLKLMAKTPLGPGEKFAFAYTSQMSKFWAASNLPGELTLYLSLISIPGKVLSAKKIEMHSQSIYQHHLVSFDSFNVTKGEQFYPGYYKVKLSNISPELESTPKSSSIKRINVEKIMLLGVDNEKNFSTKLAEFKMKILNDKAKYLTDLEQKNNTYLRLVNDIEVNLKSAILKLKKGSDIKTYTQKFVSANGQLMTTLILDDEKIASRVYDQYETIADEYRDLAKRAKNIGLVVTQLISKIEKYSKVNMKMKKSLAAKAHDQLWELRGSFVEKAKILSKHKEGLPKEN